MAAEAPETDWEELDRQIREKQRQRPLVGGLSCGRDSYPPWSSCRLLALGRAFADTVYHCHRSPALTAQGVLNLSAFSYSYCP